MNRRQAIKLMAAAVPALGILPNTVQSEEMGLPTIEFPMINSNFEYILKDNKFESVNLKNPIPKDFDCVEVREIFDFVKRSYEYQDLKTKIRKALAWLPKDKAICYPKEGCYWGMINVVQFGIELPNGNFDYYYAFSRMEKSKIIRDEDFNSHDKCEYLPWKNLNNSL